MCGENPPRTPVRETLGITPACAGKTKKCSKKFTEKGDHPRVCGKNFFKVSFEILPLGSPPRVREKPPHSACVRETLGITPACAGKTKLIFMYAVKSWDHPRVCGKNLVCTRYKFLVVGSPPRVREKLTYTNKKGERIGITPACAGKTC